MVNGFYDLSKMNTNQLKKFFKYSVLYGFNVHIDWLLGMSSRTPHNDHSIIEFIDKFVSTKSHNVCINRRLYGHPDNDSIVHEIGCSVTHGFDNKHTFLHILLKDEGFNKVISKYNLKLKEW